MFDTIATSSITIEIFTESIGSAMIYGSLVGIVVGILAYIISNK